MRPPAGSAEAALLDETIELVLDTRTAVFEILGDSVPFVELDALVRELAAELLDTYRAVAGEGVGS